MQKSLLKFSVFLGLALLVQPNHSFAQIEELNTEKTQEKALTSTLKKMKLSESNQAELKAGSSIEL